MRKGFPSSKNSLPDRVRFDIDNHSLLADAKGFFFSGSGESFLISPIQGKGCNRELKGEAYSVSNMGVKSLSITLTEVKQSALVAHKLEIGRASCRERV